MPKSVAWPNVEAAPMSIFLLLGGAGALATGLVVCLFEDVECDFFGSVDVTPVGVWLEPVGLERSLSR